MSHVTGIMIIDAPASALNNAGEDKETRADNAVAVKFIKTPGGRYPYVSAQAVRYWLRTQLAGQNGWACSPVFRETRIAYTDANPAQYDEDDLFGYMRAASKSKDEKETAKRAEIAAASTPVDEQTGEVTRISPFRVGTVVAVSPVRITQDFGTMARAEGDPVLHQHQFYRAHLKGPLALDLTSAGTFFASRRVGYKNLDSNRIAATEKVGGKKTDNKVRGFEAWRLPHPVRASRVSMLIEAIGRMEGGAKQTLHLTDTAPSVLALCVCKSGNQPLQRLFTADPAEERTVLRLDVLAEVLNTFGEDIQSDVYLGWATGFLDEERASLEKALKGEGPNPVPEKWRDRIHVSHPREASSQLAAVLQKKESEGWFA